MKEQPPNQASGASKTARLFNSYFPSLFKTPPVQRAAGALRFGGSVPPRTNRNHSINQISTHSF